MGFEWIVKIKYGRCENAKHKRSELKEHGQAHFKELKLTITPTQIKTIQRSLSPSLRRLA
jgi:hypothetical protein